ncbi:hypothetical protein AQUCO_03500231v1 [Aquilegia coerulea]|uniref:Uncharacterized protein n=1 Tax=Aquilegia coerulea TaxID=218851 RepID=A0A2G5CWT5_AQUCA|nr:hypothetical protein AQUCO_03500231v1 [Aquilegia coerulea]
MSAELVLLGPCSSVNDSSGYSMIEVAEEKGLYGGQATGGDTGIGLAFMTAAIGYKLIITMPPLMNKIYFLLPTIEAKN